MMRRTSIFGYRAEDMIGQPVAQLHFAEDVGKLSETICAQSKGRDGFAEMFETGVAPDWGGLL